MTPRELPYGVHAADEWIAWAVAVALVLLAWRVVRRARRLRGTGRLVLANATVLVALLALAACGLESWLRHVWDGTTWHAANNVTQAWLMRHWRPNAEKFRDGAWTADAAPRRLRIAFVGDSFTAGYGVADTAERFPDIIRARMREGLGDAVDLRNLGVVGADTPRETELLEDISRSWRPGRVVLCYTLNDCEYLLTKEERDGDFVPEARDGTLVRRSYLLDLLRTQWLLLRDGQGERYMAALDAVHHDAERWAEHERGIRRMAGVCAEAGIELDVVVFPLFSHWGPEYPFDAWHEAVLAAWRRAGVDVLDLRAAYAGVPGSELVAGAFDAHPNTRAHRIAADAVWDRWFRSDH